MAGKKNDGTIGKNLPSHIVDEQKKDLREKLIEAGGNITKACLMVGVQRGTFYLWYKTDPDFKAMIDDPELKKECRRVQASFYSEALQAHASDTPTTAMFFFNKAESIMKLLHMSPTKMDFKMRDINTFDDIDLAANEIQKALYEGLLEKSEFEHLKEILAIKYKIYEGRDMREELEELTKKYIELEKGMK